MKKRRTIAVCIFLLLILIVVRGGHLRQGPAANRLLQSLFDAALTAIGLRETEDPSSLVASGFLEAAEASVDTERGGRIVELYVTEGDRVAAGEILIRLDDSMLLAQRAVVEADLAVADAGLAKITAGVRQQDLDCARAELEQARVAQSAAQTAAEDALAMLHKPQGLELALTAARTHAAIALLQEKQAMAMANSAQEGLAMLEESVQILEEFEPFNIHIGPYQIRVKRPAGVLPNLRYERDIATYDAWEAWAGAEQAQATRTGAAQYLAQLKSQEDRPLSLQAQANAAESEYRVASAAVAQAEAVLEGLQMGATTEQIASVAAQVEIARAALRTTDVQLGELQLAAPISGVVLERTVQVGEVAVPGVPLLNLGDLDNLTLTVYISERDIGRIRLRQPVTVTVDAYPGRTFSGIVTYVGNEAEFTPNNVQTHEQRVSLVFEIKVTVPNADHDLKPGMPADARLELVEDPE